MSITFNNYIQQLQQYMPQGQAWSNADESVQTKFISALAEVLMESHKRAEAALSESDPRQTTELLSEWETDAGLPDGCVPLNQTQAERRAALVAKLLKRGGQNRQYYIDVAKALGYIVTITEFRPFTVESTCDDALMGENFIHNWRINAPTESIREFSVDSACAEPLRTWGNELLECVLTKIKPAHTSLSFGYGATT